MKNKIKVLWSLFLVAGCFSCTDPAWNEHYSSKVDDILDMTLTDAIRQNDDLSTFLTMLEKTGYDTVLAATQSYTIWAPINEALADVDLSDVDEMSSIVKNHISRFPYVTSTTTGVETVRMLDKKILSFSQNGEDFYFGNQKLLSYDCTCNNGILHTIDGREPYLRNIWEFMKDTRGYDSIYKYMASYEVYEFDEDNSEVLGINEYGQTVYDSVFNYSNLLLTSFGSIKTEDSIYTMILPDNQAWIEMYDSIKHFFQYDSITDKRYADSMEESYSKVFLVRNLIFRGNMSPTEIQAKPTLYPTYPTLIEDPAAFFAGTSDTILSNGRAYRTSSLNYTPDLWCPTIKIEGESFGYHTPDTSEVGTRSLFSRSARNSWLKDNISSESYLDVVPLSASTRPYITFSLPMTLSASYNIYCVFLPLNVNNAKMDSSKLLPTKVRYTLSYVNPNGKITSRTYSNNNLYTTDPTKIDTVLITQNASGPQPFKFPYANYGEETTKVTLRLTSAVNNEEFLEYTREMLIDCIILEPVY